MSDRLKEIKRKLENVHYTHQTQSDFMWLIAKVERLRRVREAARELQEVSIEQENLQENEFNRALFDRGISARLKLRDALAEAGKEE